MKAVKVQISGRSKAKWAIELAPAQAGNQAVMYGAYRNQSGFVCYPCWDRKKDAEAEISKHQERARAEEMLEDFNWVGSRHHY